MKIEQLSHSYEGTKIFANLRLHVHSQQFLLIRGPSGCGKSTLLKLIANLLPIQSGHIEFDLKAPRIAYLHQDCHLIDHWNARENLRLVSADFPQMEELFNLFQMSGVGTKLAKNLSGGEKQRVSIIRILLQQGDIVLLDEPTAHLDDRNVKQAMNLLRKRYNENIVVIVSHDQRIESYAEKVIDWKEIVNNDY